MRQQDTGVLTGQMLLKNKLHFFFLSHHLPTFCPSFPKCLFPFLAFLFISTSPLLSSPPLLLLISTPCLCNQIPFYPYVLHSFFLSSFLATPSVFPFCFSNILYVVTLCPLPLVSLPQYLLTSFLSFFFPPSSAPVACSIIKHP